MKQPLNHCRPFLQIDPKIPAYTLQIQERLLLQSVLSLELFSLAGVPFNAEFGLGGISIYGWADGGKSNCQRKIFRSSLHENKLPSCHKIRLTPFQWQPDLVWSTTFRNVRSGCQSLMLLSMLALNIQFPGPFTRSLTAPRCAATWPKGSIPSPIAHDLIKASLPVL